MSGQMLTCNSLSIQMYQITLRIAIYQLEFLCEFLFAAQCTREAKPCTVL